MYYWRTLATLYSVRSPLVLIGSPLVLDGKASAYDSSLNLLGTLGILSPHLLERNINVFGMRHFLYWTDS